MNSQRGVHFPLSLCYWICNLLSCSWDTTWTESFHSSKNKLDKCFFFSFSGTMFCDLLVYSLDDIKNIFDRANHPSLPTFSLVRGTVLSLSQPAVRVFSYQCPHCTKYMLIIWDPSKETKLHPCQCSLTCILFKAFVICKISNSVSERFRWALQSWYLTHWQKKKKRMGNQSSD